MISEIAVIGGGIIGLSSAVALTEHYSSNQVNVTLLSDELSPNTTGDVSAGLWMPYICGSTPEAQIIKWSGETYDFFHHLWKSGFAAQTGICLQSALRLTCAPIDEFYWKDVGFGHFKLNDEQLNHYREKHGKPYTCGANIVTFTCEPTKMLPYLMKRFIAAGGKFLKTRITSIENLAGKFDLVVNCTGLGARSLMGDDDLVPIRGQVHRIDAPASFQLIIDDDHYVIPNTEATVLGGTSQKNDYSIEVSEVDRESIWNGCKKMMPAIENGKNIVDCVGLRPARTNVRLEAMTINTTVSGKDLKIIHNYGHGGSGVTLCWGCAMNVVALAKAFE